MTRANTYQEVTDLRKQILAGMLDDKDRLVTPTFAMPGGKAYNRIHAAITEAHLMDDARYTWDRWDATAHKQLTSRGGGVCPTELALRWLRMLVSGEKPKPWIYLWGPVGVGKSHLSCVMGVYWIARTNKAALRINWSAWLARKRESYTAPAESISPEMYSEHLVTVPLLILDDISLELTEHSLKYLYLILEGRVSKPTILTSNLDTDVLRQNLQKGRSTEAQDWGVKVSDRLGTGVDGRLQISIAMANKNGTSRRQLERNTTTM